MSGGETSRAEPERKIDIPSVPNLRDIGGYAVAGGGRVRMGQLYRSVELNHLHGDDLAAMEALGIRTIFDLRTEDERKAQPDVVPAGVEEVVCDVLAGDRQTAPAQLFKVLGDPVAAGRMLGGGKAVALFEDGYRRTVGLPSALAAYRTFFRTIARGERRPALKPLFDKFAAAGGDPHLLEPVLGVEPAYLHTAIDEMRTRFGSVEGYFTDGLGLDAATQEALRRALVEPAA